MEKGIASVAAQNKVLEQVKEVVKDKDIKVRILAVVGVKALFYVGDDIFAEKIYEPLKLKIRELIDAVYLENDIDKSLMLVVDIVPMVLDLFKKDNPE